MPTRLKRRSTIKRGQRTASKTRVGAAPKMGNAAKIARIATPLLFQQTITARVHPYIPEEDFAPGDEEMSNLVFTYYPNKLPPIKFAPGDTNWHVLASDGTWYDTVALLLAAGKKPYPGLTSGAKIGVTLLHCLAANGKSAGTGVLYVRDFKSGNALATPATVDNAENGVGGSDQQVSLDTPYKILWLMLETGTDICKVAGAH